jgi:amino acid adenylation domain-containing protein
MDNNNVIFTGSSYNFHFNFWSKFIDQKEGFTFTQKTIKTILKGRDLKSLTFTIDKRNSERINYIGNNNEIGAFICLVGTFGILLQKYTDQENIIIHTPPYEKSFDALLSPGSVPLIFEVPRKKSFREYLGHVAVVLKESYKYQNYNINLINNLSGNIYNSNILIYHNKVHALDSIDLLKYDLIISIENDGEGHKIEIKYDSDSFDDWFIANVSSHLIKLLPYLDSLDTPLKNIDILSPDEKEKLVEVFNDTKQSFLEHKTIQGKFEEVVREAPKAIAIVNNDVKLTYEDLNARANRLATYLRKKYGLKPNDVVAIIVDRSELMIISILAILKSGAAYVSIDPALSSERLEYILKDSDAKVLILESEYLSIVEGYENKIFVLDLELDTLSTSSPNLINANTSRDLAYVIYTSGSTGNPKGVMIEHFSVVNLGNWQRRTFNVSVGTNIVQVFSYSFDGAVADTFMALLNGGTLHILKKKDLEPSQLVTFINKNKINVGLFVPSVLKEVNVDLLHDNNIYIASGAEICSAELAKKWSRKTNFVNAYGPTEYTVISHLYRVSNIESISSGSIPIGTSIDNTSTYILDSNMEIVPLGIQGEIYLSGAGIARGYLNNHNENNSKFIPNKFFLADKFIEVEIPLSDSKDANFINVENRRHNIQSTAGISTELTSIDVVKWDEHLDQDITESTKLFIKQNEQNQIRVNRLFRCLHEGFDDSNASFGLTKEILKKIFDLNEFTGLEGIELGFGNGEVMENLRELGAKIKGIELNPFFIQKGRNKKLSVQFGEVDLDEENFRLRYQLSEDSLDFSISTLLLDRVEKPMNLLKNILMVLKPGGKFALQTLLPINPIRDEYVKDKTTYTPEKDRITTGENEEDDKLKLVQLLYELGGENIKIFRIPFAVMNKGSLKDYIVFSFTGQKSSNEEKGNRFYSRMYRTGDYGRFLLDGAVDFVGRRDDQIKLRGYRLQLKEIEAKILEYDSIKQAVVLAREDLQGAKQLVGFYKVKENNSVDVKNLNKHLKEKLPDYMIPTFLMELDEFPLSISGKVDFKTLQKIQVKENQAKASQLPKNNTESKLKEIWEAVLGIQEIGLNENFFEIGGDSIKAIQIAFQVKKELNTKLDVINQIFLYPTIEALAREILHLNKTEYEFIPALEEQYYYNISHAQKRLWFIEQLNGKQKLNNIPVAYSVTGSLDIKAFEETFNKIIQRHEILRSSIVSIGGSPKQVIHSFSRMKLNVVDLRGSENKEEQVKIIVDELAETPFDISVPPLIRMKLLQIEDQSFVFALVMHHIVSDGWSMHILVNEVIAIYNALLNKKELDLPPLSIQYKDFSIWQNKKLSDEFLEEHKRYWLEKFKGELPVLNLPTDFDRPSINTFEGKRESYKIDTELTAQLNKISKKYEVSLFMFSLTWVKVLLAKVTGQHDIIVATPITGRDHPDLENQIGFYLNILALRTQIDDNDTLNSLLKKVKQISLEAFKYQSYPFDVLVNDLNLQYKENSPPLFGVIVQTQNSVLTTKQQDIKNLSFEPLDTELAISKADLTFDFADLGDEIELNIEYNTNLFLKESIDRIKDNLVNILYSFTEDNYKLLSEIKLLSTGNQNEEEEFLKKMELI